ncbi:MAG: hypothetical protein U0929_11850 [Planctomycetaceae bacterium]
MIERLFIAEYFGRIAMLRTFRAFEPTSNGCPGKVTLNSNRKRVT